MGVANTGMPVLEVDKEGDQFEVEMPLKDIADDTVGATGFV
jgi:hypothetical protein